MKDEHGTKRAPRLWIIDPSMDRAEDQGVSEVLDGWDGEHRLFRPAMNAGDGPGAETGHDVDGIVLMGSRASALDGYPWLRDLASWVAPVVEGAVRVPLLGICFGHQLVAHLAGAPIGFLGPDHRKRVGVECSRLEGGRLLPGSHELRVVVSHREEVKACPAGFRVVARRGPVEIDGLEHETRPVYSFQFHPEARDEFARHAGIDPDEIDERVRRDNRSLLEAFRRQVRRAAE